MAGQLLMLVVIIGGVWLIMDQFVGEKRISKFVTGVTGL